MSFERHLRNSIESLVTEATRSVPEDYSAAVETHFRDYLFAYHFDLLVNGYRPCLLQSIYHIALAGLCPIMWKGTWPQGFCYVYIPPTHPWATSGIPAAWQASPEVVKQANRRVKPQPQVALAVPNEAPADWSALRTLVATRSPVEALAAWWEPWAETPRCRQVLQRIAAVVQRLEVDGRCLRIHTDLTDLSQAVVIEARAPATSDLPPLPRSAAALVRRHNGITLIDGQRREVFSPSLARGRFPVEFALWWTPDPDDPAEPFRKPPIVPCSDGQDIWAYHQLRERAPGEPELRRIDHEGGDLRAALHYGAPGVILRLIHEAIRKDGPDGRRDHGLRLDHGDIHGEANVL